MDFTAIQSNNILFTIVRRCTVLWRPHLLEMDSFMVSTFAWDAQFYGIHICLRCSFMAYTFSRDAQFYGVHICLRCTVLWVFMLLLCANVFPQMSHSKGFSPVCILSCNMSLARDGSVFGQYWQCSTWTDFFPRLPSKQFISKSLKPTKNKHTINHMFKVWFFLFGFPHAYMYKVRA